MSSLQETGKMPQKHEVSRAT